MNRKQQLLNFFRENPDDTFILFALAKEFEAEQDFGSAEKNYLRILELDKNYVGVYYHLGKLNEGLGKFQEAAEFYRKGLKVSALAGDLRSHSELQNALANLGAE